MYFWSVLTLSDWTRHFDLKTKRLKTRIKKEEHTQKKWIDNTTESSAVGQRLVCPLRNTFDFQFQFLPISNKQPTAQPPQLAEIHFQPQSMVRTERDVYGFVRQEMIECRVCMSTATATHSFVLFLLVLRNFFPFSVHFLMLIKTDL